MTSDYERNFKISRPLMILGIIILLGCAGALFIGALSAICAAVAAVLAAAVIFIKRPNTKQRIFTATVLLLGAISLVSFAFADAKHSELLDFAGETVMVSGQVEKIEYSGTSGKYTVRGEIEADGERHSGVLVLYGSKSGEIYLFDEVELKAKLYEIDSENFYRYKDCDVSSGELALKGSITEVISAKAPQKTTVKMKITQMRQNICDGLMRLLPDYRGSLLSEMTVGLSGRTDSEVREAVEVFRTAGISHILVVSGLHLMIVSNAVLLCLKMFGLGERVSAAAASLFVVFYIFLAGAEVGVVRAGIMVLFVFLAALLGRQSDGLTAISLAAAIIVTLKPFSLLSPSMWLSFSAALGIMLLSGRMTFALMRKLRKLPMQNVVRTVTESFCVSFSAWAATLPVAIITFNGFSLYAVLVNMIIAPLLPIIVVAGMAAGLLSLTDATFFLTRLSAGIAGCLIAVIKWISERIAEIPFAKVETGYGFVKLWVVGCIIMLLTALLIAPKSKKCLKTVAISSAFALIVSVGVYAVSMRNTATVRIAALEEGSAVIVEYKGERFAAAEIENKGDALLFSQQISAQSGGKVEDLAIETDNVKVLERAVSLIKPENLIADGAFEGDEKIAETTEKLNVSLHRKAENMQITLQDGKITAKAEGDGVWLICVDELRMLYVTEAADVMELNAADTDVDLLILGRAKLSNAIKLRNKITVSVGYASNYYGYADTIWLDSGENTVIMTENGRIF